jgi:cysteine desulfurase
MIYLDNNATTFISADTKKAMLYWCNRGNPSASYKSADLVKGMLATLQDSILGLSGISAPDWCVLFNSGASESNATVLSSVIRAYQCVSGRSAAVCARPHIVTSSIEHKSILDLLKSYADSGMVEVTFIDPLPGGHINPAAIRAAIQPNTCLVTIMHANNETGAINDIREIGRIAHEHRIPFHVDTVQTFGKNPVQPLADNVDSYCISFHKLQGPPGVGALVIRNDFWRGYNLQPLIFGAQNGGRRGGTENTPGLGASLAALGVAMQDRAAKNTRLAAMKALIIGGISNSLQAIPYMQYLDTTRRDARAGMPPMIVFISGIGSAYLANTVLLSVVRRAPGVKICNIKIKKKLEDKGIIISVGSACNTKSDKASHVLYALKADAAIRSGALRISLGDMNTADDCRRFVAEFCAIVAEV